MHFLSHEAQIGAIDIDQAIEDDLGGQTGNNLLSIAAKCGPVPEHFYITKTGRHYASIVDLSAYLGVGQDMLYNHTQGVRRVHPEGYRDPIYCLEDFLNDRDIQYRLFTEVELDADGTYLDDQGDIWISVDGFWSTLPDEISSKTRRDGIFLQAQKYCQGRPAINRMGSKATIYRQAELLAAVVALTNIDKVVDPKTTCYKDPSTGMVWGGKRHWLRTKRVSNRALHNGVHDLFGSWDNVPSEPGRNTIIRDGKVVLAKRIDLYSEAVIDQILAYILEAEIKIVNGVYYQIDETRTKVLAVYKTSKELAKEIPLQHETIQRKLLRVDTPKLEGIHRHNGSKAFVFELRHAREVFKDQIEVVVNTDDDGTETEEDGSKWVNIAAYCEENTHVSRKKLEGLVEEFGLTRHRRRDARTNNIVYLYNEKSLNKISGA